jgi:hypothetical protein
MPIYRLGETWRGRKAWYGYGRISGIVEVGKGMLKIHDLGCRHTNKQRQEAALMSDA